MKRSSSSKPRSANGNGSLPETKETFSFGSGHAFADKAEYAGKNLLFDILAIAREPDRGYDAKDRWAITVKAADREQEVLTLGCNPKRDEEIAAAQAHLARGGALTNKRLVQRGNAYYINDGDC